MILIKCKECGYMEEMHNISIIPVYCPDCDGLHSLSVIEDTEEDNIIPQAIENQFEEHCKKIADYICIFKMEKEIKELGHKKCWEIIERMKNAKTRFAYRQIFFEAGGRI